MNKTIQGLSVFFLVCVTATAQTDKPRFGAGVKASTLGFGFEVGTAVTKKSNIRGGFNFFNYSDSFDEDGITYKGDLHLRSVQVTYDQYIAGGFHISPGLLIYNGNRANGTATVPAGQTFTLGSTSYYSGATNPINGTGVMETKKAAPMLLMGFGNLLPRSRHFAVNLEFGAVFQGSPTTTLNLTGNACAVSPTVGCLNAATDPTVVANVKAEQKSVNDDTKVFKYYPVVSLGFGWRF